MRRSLSVLAVFVAVVFIFGCGSEKNSPRSNIVTEAQKVADAKEAEVQLAKEAEKKKVANQSVIDSLEDFYKDIDEVEKREWYTPFKGSIPAETNVYWYVGLKNNVINQRFEIVHFTTGIGWVFWNKLIFSTNEGNWEYDIGGFAGQSGNGKSTEIVHGGKYEIFDTSFSTVSTGVELLTKGTNPILRLDGRDSHYDIRLSSGDIDDLKKAIAFYKNSKTIGGIIIKPQK